MHLLDGKSQREIERQTGVSRKIIRKYIDEYEEQRRLLLEGNPDSPIDIQEPTASIVEAPKYNSSNRANRKMTDELIDVERHITTNGNGRLNSMG